MNVRRSMFACRLNEREAEALDSLLDLSLDQCELEDKSSLFRSIILELHGLLSRDELDRLVLVNIEEDFEEDEDDAIEDEESEEDSENDSEEDSEEIEDEDVDNAPRALYTISPKMLKSNCLADLSKIVQIKLA